jgi:hypothetical protein
VNKNGAQSPVVKSKLIASPMLKQIFSPSNNIGKSPVMGKKSVFAQKEIGDLFLGKKEDDIVVDTVDEKKQVGVKKKAKNIFKNIESIEKNQKFGEIKNHDDMPITSGLNTTHRDGTNSANFSGNTTNVIIPSTSGTFDDDFEDDIHQITFEGYLTKFSSSNSVLKRWFKLLGKDFYCIFYKNKF